MMRVLHVIPSIARTDGGPSEVIRGWLEHLPAENVDMTVLTTDKGVSALDADITRDPRVIIKKVRRPKRFSFSPALAACAVRMIWRADLVHIHSVHTFTSTASLWIAALLKRPVVLQPHGALDAYHWRQGETKKRCYSAVVDGLALRHVSRLIVSSAHESDDRAPRWATRISTAQVQLGVDPTLLSEVRQRRSPGVGPMVLFLGRITQKKRLDLALRAVSVVQQRGLPARLVVAGPLDPQLSWNPQLLAKRLKLSASVEFLGAVDQATRRRLLSEADVFVLPSDDESFGVSVAEALAAGCPTVATRTVGVAIDAEAAGALRISEAEPDALADNLIAVLSYEDVATNLSESGRRYAENNLTWPQSSSQLAECYRVTLSEGSR
jgi:glycosyltransferase involved in cell wall biosynthesis